MSDKVTADSITDEQIRELLDYGLAVRDFDLTSLAHDALGTSRGSGIPVPVDEFVSARARCAEIWNARQEQGR